MNDDRRDERRFAQRVAELEAADGKIVRGTVTDLSRSGFRILATDPLVPDSVVWVKLGEEGPLMARVVWYDGMAAGCEFAGKLHPDIIARLGG